MNPRDAQILIKLARDAISSILLKRKVEVSKEIKKKFSEKTGVFVTLYKDNKLRGCIGYTEPIFPLWQATIKAALGAAFEDPRFPNLEKTELDKVRIELSVLTPPELIEVKDPNKYLDKIEIGKNGLMVEYSYCKGLLLPQVATEYNWDVPTFLCNTCRKAGLPMEMWHNLKCKVYRFEAKVFKEEFKEEKEEKKRKKKA